MKKLLILPIPLLIGLLLFIAVVGLTGLDKIILAFREFSIKYVVIIIVLSFIIHVLSALKWWLILAEHGHDVSFLRVFTYKTAGFSVNYVTPFARLGGEPLKAYMVKKHGLSTTQAMSSVFIDKAFDTLFDAIIMGIFIIIILALFTLPGYAREILVLGLLLLLFILAMFSFPRMFRMKLV